MTIGNKLHEKRKATEDHIKELEAQGTAGSRYTASMPDVTFLILGLVCDIGWLIQLIVGIQLLTNQVNVLIIIDLLIILFGVIFIIYLNKIHEKEIALRYQKDLSFGLTALGGIIGIAAGLYAGSTLFLIGGVLNTIGGLPIYLSFKKGITYGIQ